MGQEPLTCAPSLLRCTNTAEDSWISLPSYTPQPASTTATLFPMVTKRAGGFPGEPRIAVHLCAVPGARLSYKPRAAILLVDSWSLMNAVTNEEYLILV